MTTIVWDGKTLAADKKMVLGGGSGHTVTKIKKIGGELYFGAGDGDAVAAMLEWASKEGNTLPEFQKDEKDYIAFYCITSERKIIRIGRYGATREIEDKYFATGTGMHYALAVMAMGGDAVKAIEIAAMFDQDTGMGIDTLTLDGSE